ncbi:hypothetical protein ABW636_07380 [Aquimarina sp. 2201CG1-2-11]|uniref:hypothetical protein n=1 Tax=Aquimarina discodermiae TaxID=3231043 RepID=UPI003461E034
MIYTVFGPVNSTLLNTKTGELKLMKTSDLKRNGIVPSELYVPNFYSHFFDCYEFRSLDVIIDSDKIDIENFKRCDLGANIVYNLRFIITVSNCSLKFIEKIKCVIKHYFNTVIFAGCVVMYNNDNIISELLKNFNWICFSKIGEDNTSNEFYSPQFISAPSLISIAKNNNIYYYSRLIYKINQNGLTQIPIRNIPKSKIKTCSVCEFREVCVDKRDVQFDGKQYYYNKECAYNPYLGTWMGLDNNNSTQV